MHCEQGGFVKLQQSLINGKEITCEACQEMLAAARWDPERYGLVMEAWMQGDRSLLQQYDDTRKASSEQKPDASEDGQDGGDEMEVATESEEVLIHNLMRSLAPVITLLPSGSHGKKVPYKCSVCTTKQFPGEK